MQVYNLYIGAYSGLNPGGKSRAVEEKVFSKTNQSRRERKYLKPAVSHFYTLGTNNKEKKIRRVFRRLKIKKVLGPDGIPNKVFKLLKKQLILYLRILFNAYLK